MPKLKNVDKLEFLDPKFRPTIVFVKSRAEFKVDYKDSFGLHQVYFDFLPIDSNVAAIKELQNVLALNDTLLKRLPKLHPKTRIIPVKNGYDYLFK